MAELFRLAFSPVHIFYTLLLLLVLVYWITVFLGALDLNFLDIHTDHDADLSHEADLSHDADMHDVDGAGGGFLLETLAFFNLGKVPFMVFFTFLTFFMWAGSLIGERLIGGALALFFLIWLVPNLLMGLFLTKAFTSPFKGMFAKMNAGGKEKKELVGKIGEVVTRIAPGRMGSISLQTDDGHFQLNAAAEGDISLEKGTRALILEFDPEQDIYLVSPFE